MKRSRGFTLIELMVVIIIIILLAGVAVALLNIFFRGQGVRQGQMIIATTFANAKQMAADQRVMHFVVFWNEPDGGRMEVHRDANGNSTYDGDWNALTTDPDPAVEGKYIDLPKNCMFQPPNAGGSPGGWIGFSPSGYCTFGPGFFKTSPSAFDSVMGSSSPTPTGDLIIKVQNQPYTVCMNIDASSGKIRRYVFLAE